MLEININLEYMQDMKRERKYDILIIANGAEAFEGVLKNIKNAKEKKEKIFLEHTLSERALFWQEDNKIIITPYLIQEALIKKHIESGHFKNVENLSPSRIDISLSEAIAEDTKLFDSLVEIIKDNPGIKISSYAVTEKFLSLMDKLNGNKLNFSINEQTTPNSEWTISYLDSKAGFRSEVQKLQSSFTERIIPEGFVCKNKKEAINVAEWFYKNGQSCVVKANYGESGWGLIIVNKEDSNSISSLEGKLNSDPIWEDTLIIIEEFIRPNTKIGGGSPSVEVLVDSFGAKITYGCGQTIVNQREFIGIAMGKDFLSDQTKRGLYEISRAIGKRYWKLGYRGFFDIDFVISSQGKPYAIETNTRRTGGTHVFDIARNIFGKSWEKSAYFISQDFFVYGNKKIPVEGIIDKLSDIIYPIKDSRSGIFITIADRWSPSYGFVIVASNSREAKQIYKKMLLAWNK